MPDIYTTEWYDSVRDAINAGVSRLRSVPEGRFVVAVEVVGDGISPYVATDATRRFLMEIDDGTCLWYRELAAHDDERAHHEGRIDYRFRGPATVFDEIAAGLLDPVDVALRGAVTVKGDMRLLLRNAEHVASLLAAYTTAVSTTWPLGRPPYASDATGDASAIASGHGATSGSGGDAPTDHREARARA
jgi:putative sterol carrier protein